MNQFEARECMNEACIFNDMAKFKEAMDNGVDLKNEWDNFIQTTLKYKSAEVFMALHKSGLHIEEKDYDAVWDFLKQKAPDDKTKRMQGIVSTALRLKVLSVARRNRINKTREGFPAPMVTEALKIYSKKVER